MNSLYYLCSCSVDLKDNNKKNKKPHSCPKAVSLLNFWFIHPSIHSSIQQKHIKQLLCGLGIGQGYEDNDEMTGAQSFMQTYKSCRQRRCNGVNAPVEISTVHSRSIEEEREVEICQVNKTLQAEWRTGMKDRGVRAWCHQETMRSSVFQEWAV